MDIFLVKNKIKILGRLFLRPFRNVLIFLWDFRLKSVLSVKESGKMVFKILDFGTVVRMRASSFETKEPETIRWIKGFQPGDKFIDVGANVGIYSLFAAFRGISVVAIEPDSLNYALLNQNIRINNYGEKILPFCLAMHDETKFSEFNISGFEWGGALNSFDNNLDYKGDRFKPVHSQGVYGTSLDIFLEKLSLKPNHLKIDVDGNEYLILLGAKKFLKSDFLKSILVELDEKRKDYQPSIKLIEEFGFTLVEKTHAKILIMENSLQHIIIFSKKRAIN